MKVYTFTKVIAVCLLFAVLAGCGPEGAFTDSRDGRRYRTIKMPDGRVWMAENLNFRMENSWCYDDSEANCESFGRLYDWNAAMMSCPDGWRVPSDDEWGALAHAVGESSAAHRLKATDGWAAGANGIDEFGFTALPAGFRSSSGTFWDYGLRTVWWTSTGSRRDVRAAQGHALQRHEVSDWEHKDNGFSVRCIK